MSARIIGTGISALGYALAMIGGWKLYRNATPDRGIGRIPIVNDASDGEGA